MKNVGILATNNKESVIFADPKVSAAKKVNKEMAAMVPLEELVVTDVC